MRKKEDVSAREKEGGWGVVKVVRTFRRGMAVDACARSKLSVDDMSDS